MRNNRPLKIIQGHCRVHLLNCIKISDLFLARNQLSGQAAQACPQECTVFNFIPVVSQAQVAWSRMPSSIQQARKNRRLVDQVYEAREISKRYRPEERENTTRLFSRLQNATGDVKRLMEDVNKIHCELLPASATATVEPMGDKLKGFRYARFVRTGKEVGHSPLKFVNSTQRC